MSSPPSSALNLNDMPGIDCLKSRIEESSDDSVQMQVESDLSCEEEAFGEIVSAVQKASQGVTKGTYNEYSRAIRGFIDFVVGKGWVTEDQKETIIGAKPHKNTPIWIVAYIMEKCDEQTCDGTPKTSDENRRSYGYAQKIRAAMTHFFGRIGTIGNTWWTLREDGSAFGNPSLSHIVSTYMVSLRRRKTRAGEAPVSARAMTPQVLKQLRDFNHRPENWEPKPYAPSERHKRTKIEDATTTSPAGRRILHAVYTIAFTCLMRIDEVLNICNRHVTTERDKDGVSYMKLKLDFRKTNQNGGVKDFCIYPFPAAEAYLCPVRALGEWRTFSKVSSLGPDAPLFPRLAANGRWHDNTKMAAETFLELFRCNLVDIKIDPLEYGTHSFRRGGCQWLSCDKRWPLRQICDWGGWSTEFTSLTIVKYLISENDDPRGRREDYFNSNRPPAVQCFACGRTCNCS